MTLEEHIDFAKNKSKHLFESAYEEKDTLIACVYGKEALISGEVADLLEELKTLRKAYELACKAIHEETAFDYCDSSDIPCRKENAFGKAWDDNKCVECCMEHYLTQARKRGEQNDN